MDCKKNDQSKFSATSNFSSLLTFPDNPDIHRGGLTSPHFSIKNHRLSPNGFFMHQAEEVFQESLFQT